MHIVHVCILFTRVYGRLCAYCIYVFCSKQHMQGGYTALICAAANGRADCVRLLSEDGANKDAANEVRVGCLRITDVAD